MLDIPARKAQLEARLAELDTRIHKIEDQLDDPVTRDAAAFLLELFRRGDEHILRYRLNAGEGVISNNILHRRDGFRDGPDAGTKRLIYRARYYQRLPRQ